MYFRRIAGEPPHWTDDTIIRRHRFTNAYRAADRVSQYLIGEVIYGAQRSQDPAEVTFRVALFRLFNKIETWTLLESQLGHLSWQSYDQEHYKVVLDEAMANEVRIYSSAYIIPPVSLGQRGAAKHHGHLALVEMMMKAGLAATIQKNGTLEGAFSTLLSFPSIGRFLGYQLSIDLNYSTILDADEGEFIVAGPGAIDGISKCFSDYRNTSPDSIIRAVADRQEEEFERLGLKFRTLFGRRLQLIDCQNLFCEISKYSRVAHPDVEGVAGRTRIKQKFRASAGLERPYFPPKWGINDRIMFELAPR